MSVQPTLSAPRFEPLEPRVHLSAAPLGDTIISEAFVGEAVPASFDSARFAAAPDGRFVGVYRQGNSRQWVQRYGADGLPEGGGIFLNEAPFRADQYSVAMDHSGNFAIVALKTLPTSLGLWVYNAGADLLTGPITIEGTSSWSQFPAIAMDADGDFVVAWVEEGTTLVPDFPGGTERETTIYHIMARRYALDGMPHGDTFRVNDATPLIHRPETLTSLYSGTEVSVDMDPDGDFVVAWNGETRKTVFVDEYDLGSSTYPHYELRFESTRVFARRYSANGTPAGAQIEVASSLRKKRPLSDVDVSLAPDGSFGVAWAHNTDVGRDSGLAKRELWVRTFSPEGAPKGTGTRLVATGVRSRLYSMSLDAAGDDFLALYSLDTPGTSEPFGQRVSAVGERIGNRFQVSPTLRGATITGRALFTTEDAEYVVRWYQRGYRGLLTQRLHPGTEFRGRLKARVIDPDGTTVSLALRKGGGGWVLDGEGSLNVIVTGTGRKSILTVTGKGGEDGLVDLASVRVGTPGSPASLRRFHAPSGTLRGSFHISGTLGGLTLRAMSDSTVDVLGGLRALRLDTRVTSAPVFINSTVRAAEWSGRNRLGTVQTENGGIGHGLFADAFKRATFHYRRADGSSVPPVRGNTLITADHQDADFSISVDTDGGG